jgi:hypothetical protein
MNLQAASLGNRRLQAGVLGFNTKEQNETIVSVISDLRVHRKLLGEGQLPSSY